MTERKNIIMVTVVKYCLTVMTPLHCTCSHQTLCNHLNVMSPHPLCFLSSDIPNFIVNLLLSVCQVPLIDCLNNDC